MTPLIDPGILGADTLTSGSGPGYEEGRLMLGRNTKRSLAVLAAALLLALIALAGALCTAHPTARADGWTWDRPAAQPTAGPGIGPPTIDGWTWDDAVTDG